MACGGCARRRARMAEIAAKLKARFQSDKSERAPAKPAEKTIGTKIVRIK